MKIHIFGKDTNEIERLKKELGEGFEYSEESPDLVICYGGDGTFLIAERVFPGVPKIFLKGSEVCNKGHDINIREALKDYQKGNYKIEKIRKLKAVWSGRFETRALVGTNDVIVRNSLPTEAVRFKVSINGKNIGSFIGDGLVVSTAYGSGGYFSSIARENFENGIGIAFSNITEETEPIYLSGDKKIEIEIIRGPAVLVADNNRDFVNLENGDKIMVEQTDEVARRILLNGKN